MSYSMDNEKTAVQPDGHRRDVYATKFDAKAEEFQGRASKNKRKDD